MKAHVGGEYHVDEELSELVEVVAGEAAQDIALGVVPHHSEGVGHVVVLQNTLVVVQKRQLRLCVDMEVVGGAGVFNIVATGCNQHCKDLQVCQPVLKHAIGGSIIC